MRHGHAAGPQSARRSRRGLCPFKVYVGIRLCVRAKLIPELIPGFPWGRGQALERLDNHIQLLKELGGGT